MQSAERSTHYALYRGMLSPVRLSHGFISN